MQSVIMLRPGNASLTKKQLSEFKTMADFHQLQLEEQDEPGAKRLKKSDT